MMSYVDTQESRFRDSLRNSVTVLLSDLNKALEYHETSEPWVHYQLYEIQRQRNIILNLDSQILLTCRNVDAEIKNASDFNLTVTSGIRHANEWINAKQMPVVQTPSPKSVKLPDVNLKKIKKFSGNPLDWPAFWESFKTAVDDRRDIGDPAKFYYLISQLEGDAALLLSDCDRTRASYIEAAQLLKQTYGKTKQLVEARLHALLDMDPPKPHHTDLRRFLGQYDTHLKALRSLGADITESGYIYSAILLRKLPKHVSDSINKTSVSDSWSLDELREALKKEIDDLRDAEEKEIENLNKISQSQHRKGRLLTFGDHNIIIYNIK